MFPLVPFGVQGEDGSSRSPGSREITGLLFQARMALVGKAFASLGTAPAGHTAFKPPRDAIPIEP